jgi:hypothetical protein
MLFRFILIFFSLTSLLYVEEETVTEESDENSVQTEESEETEETEEKKKVTKISLPKTLEGVHKRIAEINEELKTVKRTKKVKQKIELTQADKIFEENVRKTTEGVVVFNEVKRAEFRYIFAETVEFKRLKKEKEVLNRILRKFKNEDVFQKRELIKQEDEEDENLNKAILNENYIEPDLLTVAHMLAAKADLIWKQRDDAQFEKKSFLDFHFVVKKLYLGMSDKDFLSVVRNGVFKNYNLIMVKGKNHLYSISETKYYDEKEFGSISYQLDRDNRITSFEFKDSAHETIFGFTNWSQERFLKAFRRKYKVMNFEKETEYVGDNIVVKYSAIDDKRNCKIEILTNGFRVSKIE